MCGNRCSIRNLIGRTRGNLINRIIPNLKALGWRRGGWRKEMSRLLTMNSKDAHVCALPPSVDSADGDQGGCSAKTSPSCPCYLHAMLTYITYIRMPKCSTHSFICMLLHVLLSLWNIVFLLFIYLYICLFINPYPRICLLILEREEESWGICIYNQCGRNIDWLPPVCALTHHGLNAQPR